MSEKSEQVAELYRLAELVAAPKWCGEGSWVGAYGRIRRYLAKSGAEVPTGAPGKDKAAAMGSQLAALLRPQPAEPPKPEGLTGLAGATNAELLDLYRETAQRLAEARERANAAEQELQDVKDELETEKRTYKDCVFPDELEEKLAEVREQATNETIEDMLPIVEKAWRANPKDTELAWLDCGFDRGYLHRFPRVA